MGLRSGNYALLTLYVDQAVHKTVMDLRMAPEFWLFKINPLASRTFTEPKDCFIDTIVADEFNLVTKKRKLRNKSTGYRANTHKRYMTKINDYYKGMESYQSPPINLKEDHYEKCRITGVQTNFTMALVLCIILAVTVVLLISRRNVNQDFWLQSGVFTDLVNSQSGYNFYEIASFEDIDNYFLYTYSEGLYALNSNTTARIDRFYSVGPLRFRQLRTKSRPCLHAAYGTNLTCYETVYNSNTKQTTNLANDTTGKPYLVYQDSTSAQDPYVGDLNTYDSSGYVLDISLNLTVDQFITEYEKISNGKWLDIGTRALFVTTNMYLPNSNQFIDIFILIEIDAIGQCYPNKVEALAMTINLYTGDFNDTTMFGLELARFLLVFYLLFVFFKAGFTRNAEGIRGISGWFSVKNLGNLVIFAVVTTAFAYSFKVQGSTSRMLDNDYYDLGSLYYYYTTGILLNAWILLIVFFRLILTLSFSNKLSVYLYTLDLAVKNIVYYICILLPILVSMSVLSEHIYGPYMTYYRNLQLVAVSNVLFTIGYGDVKDYLKVSSGWTVGFLLIYFFVVSFFLLSAFLGIMFDSYRVSELRNRAVEAEIKKAEDYRPWKMWLGSAFSMCRKEKSE